MQNDPIVSESTESIIECWNLCQSTENCFWFSFSQLMETCLLFNICPEIDENENFVTSEVDCTYDIQGEIRNFFFKHLLNFGNLNSLRYGSGCR